MHIVKVVIDIFPSQSYLLWVSPESCHFVRAIEETGTIAKDVIEIYNDDKIVVKNLVPEI